jgi:excinuclease ABC subunit C
MAAANAREAMRTRTMSAMADLLADRLRAPAPLRRIEAVDISHTGGRQTRAGLVVFQDEEPLPGAFRQYALDDLLARRNADPGDDYAALAVWAERRAQSGPPWPDLLLIDGGKGQLAAVARAFTDHGLSDAFLLASIAKARDGDGRADRRAGNVGDRIFLPGRANPLPLAPGCPELLFLQRIRDAAHNFTLGRHRRTRAAHALSGELTRLPGVGPVLARRLFEHFGSLAAMAEAGLEALTAVPGLGIIRARLIAERLALLMSKKEA